jgi:hypothetical protein
VGAGIDIGFGSHLRLPVGLKLDGRCLPTETELSLQLSLYMIIRILYMRLLY